MLYWGGVPTVGANVSTNMYCVERASALISRKRSQVKEEHQGVATEGNHLCTVHYSFLCPLLAQHWSTLDVPTRIYVFVGNSLAIFNRHPLNRIWNIYVGETWRTAQVSIVPVVILQTSFVYDSIFSQRDWKYIGKFLSREAAFSPNVSNSSPLPLPSLQLRLGTGDSTSWTIFA